MNTRTHHWMTNIGKDGCNFETGEINQIKISIERNSKGTVILTKIDRWKLDSNGYGSKIEKAGE